jgi:hypothetical protein
MAPRTLRSHLSDQVGAYHQAVRRCFRSAGAPMPALHSSGSIEGVKRAIVSSADAVGVLPAFAIAHELARGEFEVLRIEPALPILQLEAVLAGGEQARPRQLVSNLLDRLRAMPLGELSHPTARQRGRSRPDASTASAREQRARTPHRTIPRAT